MKPATVARDAKADMARRCLKSYAIAGFAWLANVSPIDKPILRVELVG
jgi:hypothetical protein